MLDLYIKDIEERGRWEENVLGTDNIINIDHYASVEEFEKNISSTNLAIEWVKKNGALGKDYRVVVNHMDCDSVLSSLVIRGILPPDEKFGEAAIAADHTGEENEIADFLQALEDKRDLEFSARNLKLLLDKKELDPEAQKLLAKKHTERIMAREAVESGEFDFLGGVAYAQFDKKMDLAFFPALLPDAQVILLFCPHKMNANAMEAKIRLGMAAPAGLTLSKLNIENIDPNFGYRWNAGSNRRAGGSDLKIDDYAKRLNEKLEAYMKGKKE